MGLEIEKTNSDWCLMGIVTNQNTEMIIGSPVIINYSD